MNISPSHLQGPVILSPFLPGTKIQFAWDSTSLGYIKGCPRLYQYVMIDGWQGKTESLHLRFGIEYHLALQDYDIFRANDIDHDDAVHDVVQALLLRTGDFRPSVEDYGNVAKYKNRENLVRTVIWYLDHFKDDPATTYIMENGKPAVELSFRFELDWGPTTAEQKCVNGHDRCDGGPVHGCPYCERQPYLLSGHIDRVVEYSGDLYAMDRKTTKSQPGSWYYSMYEPDNQMTLYTLASRVILNTPVKGVIIDAAQIQIDASKFGRGFTFRTQEQLEEWLKDLAYVFEAAEKYATENYWPQNDKHCNSFRSEESGQVGCPFREVCSKSPQVRDRFLASNFVKGEPWNPLKAR